MKRKKRREPEQYIKVPFVWLICSWFCMTIVGLFLFFFLLKRYGVSFPIAAGQNTDPYFFAGIVGILTPLIIQVFILKVFKGILLKHSALEIAREVGKDVAVTTGEIMASTVLDVLTGSSGSSSSRSSSGDRAGGGGGQFGGGGASGGY